MLAFSLSMLLVAWTVSAVRYAVAIRNAEPQFVTLEALESLPQQLAA